MLNFFSDWSYLAGLSDPYVKGKLGTYQFRTKIQKKTLAPKWQEEFKIPIHTWESPNVLLLEVFDKDRIFDDSLGSAPYTGYNEFLTFFKRIFFPIN